VTESIAKIKIFKEYWIPVEDPSGTLSTTALKNQNMQRMYTPLTIFLKYIEIFFILSKYFGTYKYFIVKQSVKISLENVLISLL